MQKLIFSYNWNHKLDCNVFTTLRLSDRFKIGEYVNVECKSLKFVAQIIDKKTIMLNQINNFVAYLDTGYSVDECRNLLRKMYKNKNVNWDVQKINFYLLKKIKKEQE